jgi:capsular polysaccharide transport system ATP-binding protein
MVVRLERVTKSFWYRGREKFVARNVNFEIPRGHAVGLLGRNGSGKSTLMQIISGAILPDSGEIKIEGTVSWPVGFQGSFHRDLTGAQNAKFLARIYGVDTETFLEFVADFSELGPAFHQPLRMYSSGMRSRLGFGCSMGIHFDTYLIDEVTAVGDGAFRAKSEAVFRDRLKHSGALFVSHNTAEVERLCSSVVVLENGVASHYFDVAKGIERHEKNLKYHASDGTVISD